MRYTLRGAQNRGATVVSWIDAEHLLFSIRASDRKADYRHQRTDNSIRFLIPSKGLTSLKGLLLGFSALCDNFSKFFQKLFTSPKGTPQIFFGTMIIGKFNNSCLLNISNTLLFLVGAF